MAADETVTHWFHRLQAGDHDAAQKLWERYFAQMVRLARKKLRDAPRRAADEEDVALSAFDSFCKGAARGLYPQLQDRGKLWKVLITITACKAYKLVRDQNRLKRGGGAVRGDSALLGPEGEAGLDQIVGTAPTPEFAAQVAEECQRLLEGLGDPELREIALAKMEGYTTQEIAARRNCAPRTVERKLELIRSRWEQELTP